MIMQKYIYQKFLLHCNYESIDLQANTLTISNNLVGQVNYTIILLSELDCTIDTEEDFVNILSQLDCKKSVLLVNDRLEIDNPIVSDFGEATIKAYIHFFNKYGIDCSLVTTM